jgi:dienelactone hydrolase
MVPTMIGNRIGVTWPGVRDWFAALRLGEGAALPVGAAGYCWGGKHVVLLGAAKDLGGPAGDRPLIDAGFTAHPSLLSLPGDVEALRVPTSFAMAEHDMGLSVAQQQQIKAIVEAKPDKERGEVRTYEGVGHGFSVRADFTNEKVAQQAAEAEHQALDWFNHHFGF